MRTTLTLTDYANLDIDRATAILADAIHAEGDIATLLAAIRHLNARRRY